MSKLKVKPCPFCGSDDISFSAFSLSPDAYALCGHCNAGIEIQVGWDEMTEKEHDEKCNLELQKVWNRRAVEQPQLNPNQQIVFEWLKGSYVQGYGPAVIRTIHLLQKENTVDITDSSYVRGAYRALNTVEEAVVVKMFADWALEQEEEK